MLRTGLLMSVIALSAMQASLAQAGSPKGMNLRGQVHSAFEELGKEMAADVNLKGRKLRLGNVNTRAPGNFQSGFEAILRDVGNEYRLLDESSDFALHGSYDFLPSATPDNKGFQVIQIVLEITDRSGSVLQTATREVNDSGDVGRMLGRTVALPDTPDFKVRNEALKESLIHPRFELLDRTKVIAPGQPNYAVEIVKRLGGVGEPVVVVPADRGGEAMVDLSVKDTFEIRLYNQDTRCDAVVEVTIDGLDVINEFNEDEIAPGQKREYEGYTIPRARAGEKAEARVVPGWLRTTDHVEDNVFQFVIGEFGKGAASAKKSRSSRGVICVSFYEAVPAGEVLPSRSFGEVDKGEPLTVEYEVKEMTLRDSPVATVSIRYAPESR